MSILSVFMPSRDLHSHDGFVRVNLFDGTFFLSPIYVDPIAGFQHLCSLQLKLHQRAARRRYRCYFLIVTPAHALAAGDGPAAAMPTRSHATQASDRASPPIARGEPRRHRGPCRRPACRVAAARNRPDHPHRHRRSPTRRLVQAPRLWRHRRRPRRATQRDRRWPRVGSSSTDACAVMLLNALITGRRGRATPTGFNRTGLSRRVLHRTDPAAKP